jgi:hypothetical protein
MHETSKTKRASNTKELATELETSGGDVMELHRVF